MPPISFLFALGLSLLLHALCSLRSASPLDSTHHDAYISMNKFPGPLARIIHAPRKSDDTV